MYSTKFILISALLLPDFASSQTLSVKDVYPDKARYAPQEVVHLQVELEGAETAGAIVLGKITDLDQEVGTCNPIPVPAAMKLSLSCSVPSEDFRGYLATIKLLSAAGKTLQISHTAIDVSSDWRRFPRYGYLAHYNHLEVPDPAAWVAQLNRFHINGLQFYDFQYRHDQPLAGSVQKPSSSWKDIAGREIDADVVRAFIDEAHARNMMAMAYNASYSAYDDAFSKPYALPVDWATWPTANGPRTIETAKTFNFNNAGWSTSKLFFMNQNELAWQKYLFSQMQQLFEVYPFDGWHIDTFGEKSGFAFDGSPVNYIMGFKPYIDHASVSLKKPIVMNAVNTYGQASIATSRAEFVYSELWEDHETFASILGSAEQVHLANPDKAYVIAAYVHRHDKGDPESSAKTFNPASVLLTDATIFSSGAAHIELGDGERMLSSEYFPADTRLVLTQELIQVLRHYYDYLTAYEVYLRDSLKPAIVKVSVDGRVVDPLGVPNTIWTISRQRGSKVMVHLINLLSSDDPHWRDISISRSAPPELQNMRVRLSLSHRVRSIGWSSPDQDGGQFHHLDFQQQLNGGVNDVSLNLPRFLYWDTLFIEVEP